MPARIWWSLAKQAEARNIDLSELVAERLVAAPDPRTVVTTRERVETLHAIGLTDREIAQKLHCGKSNVAHHRWALGLAPNYGRGKQR